MQPKTRYPLVVSAVLLLVVMLAMAGVAPGQALAAPGPLPASTACTGLGTGTVTCSLWANSGTLTLPGGASVTVWGYADSATNGTANPVQIPGPVLIANAGDTVNVTLTNNLGEATALYFQGLDMIPDLTGAAAGGGTQTYNFVASNPGTYLYEAGLLSNAQHQVAMGLYGVLIVRPLGAPNQAYSGAGTAFTDEALVVLSEIDPALNGTTAAPGNPAAFDMRNYAPKYRLINGKAYPQTDPIATAAGNTVLLRYANAALGHHTMSTLGIDQTIIAEDASATLNPRRLVADTLAPGQTVDALVVVPTSLPVSGVQYALYDSSMLLYNNGGPAFGGMLTFVTVAGTPPSGDTTGPATSAVALAPNPTNGSAAVTLSGTISDVASGNSNVTAAEYFVDAVGANGVGCAITTGAFGTPTVSVSALIPTSGATAPCADLAALSSGKHTFYVHGLDSTGNWGTTNYAVLNLDKTGPAISGLMLSPNPTNGTVNVALGATGDDRATGNSNIAAAQYWIDSGAAQTMAVNAAAPVASLTASIPMATVAALTEGSHVVSVRSQDALGNWGAPATITLVVDKTGPTTGTVVAAPNPTNGVIGFNSSTPAVRVTASFADALSKVSAAEGFIDALPANPNGKGFIFIATDGVFNSQSESGYSDIPLATINALSQGNHTIRVHGKDSAGNWATTYGTVLLVVDKTSPTISNVSLTPNTIGFGTASVALAVTATDTGTGVAGGQYWIDGTATPPASPTAFVGTTATIVTSALVVGNHTVYVRVRDQAGNWSAVSSTALVVIQAINDAVTITANTNATQNVDTAAPGLLANDQPIASAGRTARLASAPVRTSGTGAGTITVSCPAALGTAATPAISGNTVCTNGAYRITLNGVGTSGTTRRASKQGTYQFTYVEILNGATSTATVTITVN